MIFTIDKQPMGWVVAEGKLPGANQEFGGRGILIFVRGKIGKDYPVVANLALNEVQARGGNAGKIYRSTGAATERKSQKKAEPEQRRLFDDN